ncbi:MAG: tRNA 2-thiouridine(34) synthase MnmA [Pseudomonadota bacterium]
MIYPPTPDTLDGPVLVGMSGGVDSSVVAWLLQDRGYAVEGLHMTNWEDDDGYCSAADDLQDARAVCDQLGIPLHHVNFASEYRDAVFEDFLAGYANGRTPNPDVLCNREIKFGVFADYARRLGAAALATGHYARLSAVDGEMRLLRGIDPNKDQSYFLHAVDSAQFHNVLFPLGGLTKPEVRDIAHGAGLTTRNKKDSTGICFIGERPFRNFLAQFLPASPGEIVDDSGRSVGRHHGLMYYTIGQRQGLGIGGQANAPEAPWYVAEKRLSDNTLRVVQGKHHPALLSNGVICKSPHWVGSIENTMSTSKPLAVKIRHRQPDQPCTATIDSDGQLHIDFDVPQWGAAAGQYAVLYDGERCLGGGAIDSVRAFQPAAAAAAVNHGYE